MSNFLNSVKADLLGRRLLPIFVIAGVALLGALAYAVLAGGGSPASTAALTPVPTATNVSGIAVTEGHVDVAKPVAETTSGSEHRGGKPPRDPFTPLPSTSTQATSPAAASAAPGTGSASEAASSGSSSTPETESGSSSGGSNEGTNSGTNNKSGKPKKVYNVAVLFGTAPAGTPPLEAQLTPYENLKRQQPLPDSKQPLVVFRGVIAGGKSATFTLVGEAILRGNGACLPSASQCAAIDLKVGQTEELEYIPLGAAAVVYQLQVVSITASKASASAARRAFHGQSKSGLQLLHRSGLTALPGLRYSSTNGVLVFATHKGSTAGTRAALWGTRPKL